MTNGARGYWFRSPVFNVEPGEDDETNPGRYGRQLAKWVAAKLRDRGHEVEPPIAEDWGWSVACRNGPDRVLVACGNAEDERTGAESSGQITWHCFSVAASPIWRRLLRPGKVARAVQRVDGELRAILEGDAGITMTGEP